MIEGHGDDIYKYNVEIKTNFSSNIYNHVDNSELYSYLSSRISNIGSYPPPLPYDLESDIAVYENVKSDEVCATCGATDAIYLIAALFAHKVSTILMPTFSEYADACRLYHHDVKIAYSFNINMACHNVVWICNPNNPTGQVIDKQLLTSVITSHPNTYFVIDQSYESFTIKSLFSSSEAKCFRNVIIIHSMTKKYSIPGIRIGYITACSSIIKELSLRRMPWAISTQAIDAAKFIISHKQNYKIDIQSILLEKDRVQAALKKIYGVDPWDTDTHFMLIKLRNGFASSLKDFLIDKYGILIRDASNFHGLDNHFFRIAVQTPEEDDVLIKGISEWMNMF